MARDAWLGVDLGTSGVKVVVVDSESAVVGEGEASYPVRSPRPGWAESDPGDWWEATVAAVRQALAAAGQPRIRAVGVDGQMHGLVLAREDAMPLRSALLWADRRAAAELAAWRGLADTEREALANPLVPGMTGPLLAWIARHEPRLLAEARWALLPKDWLRLRLTGKAATDPSDASATLLWDVPADTWSLPALRAAQLPADLLPPLAASDDVAGVLTGDAAAELGMDPGTPVAVGAGDTPAALLATAAGEEQAQLTVGSGAQIVAATTDPSPVPGVHVYRTAERAGWYRMAAVQNVGVVVEWVRTLLGATWEEVYAAAGEEPDRGGVVFLPHLTGERTPVLGMTGVLAGLRLDTDRTAVLRAAVEGVAFTIRHAAMMLPGGLPPVVRLAGGGSRDPRFRALLANVLGVELRPVRLRSASAVGAAHLAARAVGAGVARPELHYEPVVSPTHHKEIYDVKFEVYLHHLRRNNHPTPENKH
ncbi:putative sugar kinase protein [Thermobifida fusca YX]|uniref:Putative sugar kinase protein n=1 Tax=Thermobifida fusca (strain YX) TaxID=269800 RepID=Q47PK8_THEFY|nr:putative sugar kinase protein [Thermobifida fusca YX]MDD6792359.1 FGGY family carbohydrate kinase [Thermobifida fusca]